MDEKRHNSRFTSKRRVLSFATFLLFFYLIGNLTVLEYFGGNPDLGIPSYTKVAATTSSAEIASVQNATNISQSSRQDSESYIRPDGDDCLAACTHCILAVVSIESRSIIIEEQVVNQRTKHLQPDPHPTSFYRPPRTA